MELLTRPLTPDDAAAFRALRLRGLRDAPEAFGSSPEEEEPRTVEQVAARLAHDAADGNVVLGAFHEGRLVGMAGVNRSPRLKSRHRAELWGMLVAAEVRGRGVGGALLDEAIARARGMDGVQRIRLLVARSATAALALYRSRGFESIGVEPGAHIVEGRDVDMESMMLRLE